MDAEQLWSLCTDEASKAGVRKILDVSDEELKNITNEIEKSIPPGRIDRLKKKPGQFYTGARNPNKKPKN